jgi:hypothetical protein
MNWQTIVIASLRAFKKGCLEAILSKNTLRLLGVNCTNRKENSKENNVIIILQTQLEQLLIRAQ